jgi:hypothetical protein
MRLFAVSGLVALAAVLAVPAAASAAVVPAATPVASVAAVPPAIAPAAPGSSVAPGSSGAAGSSGAPGSSVVAEPLAGAGSGVPDVRKPAGDLLDVSCVTDKDCVAVGANMTSYRPLVETWNGKGWKALSLPMPAGENGATLNWVSCPTSKSCVAVGDTDQAGLEATLVPLVESWNGRSWSQVRVPVPAGGTGYELGNVACVSAKSCVLNGGYTLLSDSRLGSFIDVLSGGKWTLYKPPGLASGSYGSDLDGISCLSATDCVTVGSYGNSTTPSGVPANAAAAEFWNGKKWAESKVPTPSGSKGAWLYGISCVRAKACVAVGGQRLKSGKIAPLTETWTAASGKWRASGASAAGSEPVLFDVSCVSAKGCLAVGSGDLATSKTSPFSLSLHGKAWKYAEMPAPLGGGEEASDADSVTCLSATLCVATGNEGNVPFYVGSYVAYGVSAFWNGKSWHLVPFA